MNDNKKRTVKGVYEGLKSLSYETGVDFGVDNYSYEEFYNKYKTRDGLKGLYQSLSSISDESGLDFGIGSEDDWMNSFTFAKPGAKPTQAAGVGLAERAKAAYESGNFPFVPGVSGQRSAVGSQQGKAENNGKTVGSYKTAGGNALQRELGKRNEQVFHPAATSVLPEWQEKQAAMAKAEAEFGANLEENIGKSRAEIDRAVDEIDRQEAENRKRRIEEDEQQEKARREEFKRQYGYYPRSSSSGYGGMAQAMNESLSQGNHERDLYLSAKDAIDEAEDIVKAAKYSEAHNGWQEFWKGAGKKLADFETWDMGVSSLARSLNAKQVIDKLEAADGDETQLTAGERALLDALATQAVVSQYYADRIGKGYKIGQGVAESVPFMAEMIINPMSGAGSAAGKAVGKYILKKYGVKGTIKGVSEAVTKKAGAKAIAKEVSGVAGKTLAKATGHVAGSTGMALTTGLAGSLADATQRMIGDVTGEMTDDGKIEYTGREKYEGNKGKAILKGIGARTIENLSETGYGAANEIFGRFLGKGAQSLIGKVIGKTKVGRAIEKPVEWWGKVATSKGGKEFGDLMKRAQFHGTFGEFMEEIEGGITNAAVIHDQTLDTDPNTGVFNKENIWDTFIQVAATTALLGGGQVAAYGLGRGADAMARQHNLRDKNKQGVNVFGQSEWDEMREQIDNAVRGIKTKNGELTLSEEDKQNLRALTDGKSQDQKRAVMEYLGARVKNEVAEAIQGQGTESEAEAEMQENYRRGYETMLQSYESDDESAIEQSMKAASDMAIEKAQLRDVLVNQIGEETVAELEQSRLGGSDMADEVQRLIDEGRLNEADAEAIGNYMRAFSAYKGVEDFANRAGEDVTQMARMQMQPMRDEQGGMRKVTLKDGREVYIYNGDVAVNDDGTVNEEGSSQMITVYDPTEQKRVAIAANDIESVEEYKDSRTIDEETEQAGRDYTTAMLNEINGVNTLSVGDMVPREDGVNGQVVAEDGENWTVAYEDGTQATVNKQAYEEEIAKRRMEEYAQRHGGENLNENLDDNLNLNENKEEAAVDEWNEGVPERLSEGMEVRGVVLGEDVEGTIDAVGRKEMQDGLQVFVPDDNGKIAEVLLTNGDVVFMSINEIKEWKDVAEAPVNSEEVEEGEVVNEGEDVNEEVAEEAEAEEPNSAIPEENGETAEQSAANEAEENGNAGNNVSAENTEGGMTMPTHKVKKKIDGKMQEVEEENWMATTPDVAYDYLYVQAAKLGLKPETADNMVAANLKKAEKKLKEAEKATGSVISVLQKQKEAQDEVDYWQKVKKIRSQAMLAESAAEDERTKEQRAAEAAKRAAIREQRRNTEMAEAGRTAAEKYDSSERIEGNSVTRTIADKTKIKGHYVLVEADALTPSHDPFNGWKVSNGFPTTEDGASVNDRVYENDKAAQEFTEDIARDYDGQAVSEVPVVSSEGIVYDGNGRTMAGQIAARNNTDAVYIESLMENAANFGFTEEQVQSMSHPRVVLQVDEDLPYNATTFARFNKESKKKMDNTNKAVSVAKQMTDAARDAMLEIIDRYGTLDTFFASEKAADDVVNMLVDGGFITRQEAPMFKEKNSKGQMVLSSDGRSFVTNMMLGTLFDEEAIRKLGDDKDLKNSLLRAVPQIAENRRLGDYALTEEINTTIDLLYEARKSGMKFDAFKRQGNLVDGMVEDRYEPMVVLLADEMSSGVDNFRDTLTLYNNSAADELNGGVSMFEPRTREDIKKDIVEYYKRQRNGEQQQQSTESVGGQQPAAATEARPESAEAEPAVGGTQEGDGRAAEEAAGERGRIARGKQPNLNWRTEDLSEKQRETLDKFEAITRRAKEIKEEAKGLIGQPTKENYDKANEETKAKVDALVEESRHLKDQLAKEDLIDLKLRVGKLLQEGFGRNYDEDTKDTERIINGWANLDTEIGRALRDLYGDNNLYIGNKVVPFKEQKAGNEALSAPTAEQAKMVKGLVKRLNDAGIPTHLVTRDGQKKLDEVRDRATRQNGGFGPTFYSNAEKAVEGIKQEKASAEQWLAMIQKAGGLKAGEDKWIGLSDWLNDHKGESLTKQQVLDYIRENQIQVEEVEYSDARMPGDFAYNLRNELNEKADDICGDVTDEYQNEIEEAEDFSEELDDLETEMIEEARRRLDDEFGVPTEDYISIQFENDRNRLVYTPTRSDRDFSNNFAQQVWNQRNGNEGRPINETRLQYTTDFLDNKREIALTIPSIEPWNENDEIHFGDAGGGRAVAWLRFGDAVDADGKKVLVIDEIQSNRHQEGREKGYKTKEAEAEEEKLVEAVEKAQEAYDDFTRRMGDKYNGAYEDIYADMTEAEQAEANRLEKEVSDADERLQNHNVPDVPDAPFEKNWHEVAMKRMLRYAAENGYDKVAWTKGEQQAERYDLSKEIREIKIRKDGRTTPEGEALYEVYTIDTNTGREVPAASGMFNATRLKETFGKDLASRLEKVAEESQTNGAWDGWGSIAGDGLRIGGEGMKGFYDQILPRFMDKYGKKWGVKTADIELPNIGDNGLTMHSVEVTPEMKQSVMSGQPMFHKVFHGSGADFERFDSSHMGEGEGAQAYGYGHYTTEVEGIGRTYAEQNIPEKYRENRAINGIVRDKLSYQSKESAIKELNDALKYQWSDKKRVKAAIKVLETGKYLPEGYSFLYTVEIPDDNGSNYLEWDKPVSEEQLKRIEDGLLERGIPQDMVESIRKGLRYKQNRTGRYVYDRIADIILPTANNFKQASEFLHSIGFTGIKYPAQFRSGGREDGASNYVIFDENDLKITDKVKFYLSPDGEVIGYTVDGEIWIDPRYAKPDTPVHEYTHLWADGIERSNPKAFKQLVDEMRKETELWDYVRGRYPEIKNESELAKEVFAHYSGKRGRERLEKEMRAEMAKADGMVEKAKVANVFHKLRELLDKFWNMARDLFAGKVEGIENLKAEDFADMALNDLLRGFDPVRARAEQMDKEYMEAVEKGDMETAQRMVDAEARRKGYISDNEYRMNHTAPSGRDGFSKSIDNPTEIYPEDLYSPQGYHYYGDGNRAMDIESWNVFKRLHGNPDAMVTIYRAVPKSVQESKLRNGDWVTINKSYAQEHGERNINGAYKIIEDVVPAKYVFTDGNSLHEQGYDDGKEYAYKNTKNNRKLLDAVTYDDNGNVIPLSERFNKRNADIRFQKANTIDPRMMSIEERQRRGDMLRNTPAIDVEQGQITKTENKSARKAAEEWWDNNVGEPKAYDTEVGDVVIDRKSVESSLAHRYSQMKLDAITSLVDGFNNAVYLGSMPDAERRATQNHYFAYPINYNRERCYVFCRALHDNNTNRLHVHEVFVENNIKKGDTLQTAALKPHGGITLYRDILANVLDISAAKVQQNSETAKNNLQEGESENDISVVTRIGEGPQVTYTPYDEALKSAKKAGYTKAQFDRHIERVWNQRKKTAERFAEKLNLGDRVNVVLDIDELEGMNLTDRQKRAKGWYDTKTGKIYVIMDNNTGMDDVFQTILHEGVAHHGLRELFGENFDTFLDDVYAHSTEDIRREIASLSKKYNWNVRTATEEYMAKMAETQNFEHPQYESWWRMVKDWFIAMVKMIGMGDWIGNHTITENELRFVLWRSWKNLTEPEGNWGYVRQAQDIAMQAELGVGEYADKAPYGRDWKVEKPREEVPAAASGDVKYDELKAQVPDKVIMMKNGELYEIKGEDAKTAAQLLGLPTGEDGVLRIPEDMMEKSLSKLVNSGKKVAIAEPIAENKVAEDGIMLRDGEEELEGKEEDIWKDKTIGMQERLTAAKLRMAEQNKESLATVNEAVKAVGGNLYSLRIAMNLQKMYDRQTVKSVSDLARIMMQYGYMDDMKKGEVKRLLSAVKNATGKTDVTKEINTVMDIMIDNTLRRAETMLKALEKVKASKVDAKGVEVQGKLDVQGQEAMRVFKESRNMREDQLSEAMAETFDQMESDNKAIVDAAVNRYIGLKLAQEYAQSIKESIENEHDLKEAIRKEKLEVKPDKEYIASLEDAIRQNKAERVEAYAAFTGRLTKVLAQSIEGAKSFVEAEKEKVREIRHYANSDMEGKADNEHHKQDNWLKKTNNLATATILAPMRSFSEMMKLFGSKSSNGEGYLYNHFVRGFIDARQKEVRGVRGKYAILDAKAKEIFGNGVKGWADMMNYIALHPKRFPTVTLEWKDGSKRIGHKVSQGNLMYIYMVNKMTDGRMKLRKMGITDEMISKVTRQLDPRLIEMADWLQGEFLVETRNEYNETHKRIFGASMAAIEDYFPLVINEGSRHKDSEKEDEKGGADASISTKTGAIIKRKANTTPLDLLNADAMQVVLKHVTDMEHWNAFAEYNRDLNILRSYNRFENRVKNMNTVYGSGDKLWKRFNELCQVTTGTYKPKQNETDQASLKFAQGVTAAKVAFRINTALKQLLSAPAYLPYVNAAGFYKALASDIVNKETTFKWCLEHLPLFEERWKSRVAGDPKLAKSVLDWQNMHANALAKIGRIGMFPNALVDAMTVSIGAHAVYETRKAQYLKEGYSEEQAERRAIQDAEIAYNETQQSSEGAFISTVQADRSWWTVMFTIFRNASMAYTRQLWGAMRNLKNNVTPKQRRQTKEFMAKQMEREGVPADKAEAAAKKRFRKDMRKNYISLATFGYIVQFAWNFGNNMWYLLLGDDDDKKKDIWKDIFVQSMFGGLEGLIPGDLISEYGRQIVRNDYNPSKLNKDMPISSDLAFAIQKYAKGKKDEALYDMFNLAVQMGLGVNPQTISDFVLSFTDICGGDIKLAHEAMIWAARFVSAPPSQIREIYFDEIGMTGEEATKFTPQQLAERYARYQVKRGRLIEPWTWGDEEAYEKEMKKANKEIKERVEKFGGEEVNEAYEAIETEVAPMAERVKAANKATKSDYVEGAKMWDKIWAEEDAYMKYKDFKDMDKNLDELVKAYLQSETPEDAVKYQKAIGDYKKAMVEAMQAYGTSDYDALADKASNLYYEARPEEE